MIKTDKTEAVLKAFCKAQSEFLTLPKDKKGYGYNYTNLDTVIAHIRPILTKHNLGFSQLLSAENLTTLIIHAESGEYFGDTVTLPQITLAKTNEAQNLGASITYMKRYALCSILGISSDEDVDGNIEAHLRTEKKPEESGQSIKPQQSLLKGGDDTEAEKKEICTLLNSKYTDGSPIFDKTFAKSLSDLRKTMSAKEVILFLKNEISRMRTSRVQEAEQNSEFMF